MSVLIIKEPMLYCPKCQQSYKEGTQRFCSNEGERLVPAPNSGKPLNGANTVFAEILSRIAPGDERNLNLPTTSKFIKNEPVNTNYSNFSAPITTKIFKSEKDETEEKDFVEEEIQKPLPRVIKPDEIASSQANLGDRKLNPTGRLALTRENPNALLGQTVKGRYIVSEKISEDETGIAYLAEDKIVAGRKVFVRVLINEDEDDCFTDKIYAEERVSLSLLDHPHIARVLDSGELLEGKPFIISEYTEGKSVADKLNAAEEFNLTQIARIVRQTADALSEAHQSGVLHRNLKPENIILTVSSSGAEQIKLINFGASKEKFNEDNAVYKSPEQIEGKSANFTSDIYSLAVITFQMLTGKLPFDESSVNDLLESQSEGLKLHPTNLQLDLPPAIDRVIEKALAFTPSARYPKARDFGDAFANAAKESLDKAEQNIDDDEILEIFTLPPKTEQFADIELEDPIDLRESAMKNSDKVKIVAAEAEAATMPQELGSPEPPKTAGYVVALLSLLGIAVLLAGLWGIWTYFLNIPNQTEITQPPIESVFPTQTPEVAANSAPTPAEVESPPLPRTVIQPPNTIYFQNSKENLTGDLAKNFLGFSLYYPKTWQENDAQGKFLDISKNASSGTPIEQLLVSYYDSKGTFKKDAELFPALVKETNSTLKEIVPNYEVISEGETIVNNGWRAYEIKFKGSGVSENKETITLWGRRFFVPTAHEGMKNGYVITMLATSLSSDIKNIDDLGVKGELSDVLKTFEPNQTF